MLMNPKTHEMLTDCCPHCYQPLRRVLDTGFTFCLNDVGCGYEWDQHARKPLTASEAKAQLLADSKRELDHQIDRVFSAIKQRYGDDAAITTVKDALALRLKTMEKKDDDTKIIH